MNAISIYYENLCELINFSKSDVFRNHAQNSESLVIQINSELSDSYSISRIVTDLKTVFSNAKITGSYINGHFNSEATYARKTLLHFNFIKNDSFETTINIKESDYTHPILTNSMENELQCLYNQLKEKNRQIELFNRQITDSLKYAGKLQKAMIPPKEQFSKIFSNHFVIYKPKHYVSGDFFWLIEKADKIYVAVADCTGHGVPGALLSILGITFLNEISNLINAYNSLSSSDILNLLRDMLKNSLYQAISNQDVRDGMDIALCIIDKETLTLQFSGAFMPLYIVRNNELTELKADKMPIGLYYNSGHSFTESSYKLQKEDMLYLASDGYADQFGGLEQKKFKVRDFKNLLKQISNQPISEQKTILKETLEVWQNGYEQTDDITVLGIRVENFSHSSDFII